MTETGVLHKDGRPGQVLDPKTAPLDIKEVIDIDAVGDGLAYLQNRDIQWNEILPVFTYLEHKNIKWSEILSAMADLAHRHCEYELAQRLTEAIYSISQSEHS